MPISAHPAPSVRSQPPSASAPSASAAPRARAPAAEGGAGGTGAASRVDAFDGALSTTERNRRAVDDFYTAFAAKDGAAMTAAYADNATFSDEVFPDLRGAEPGAMWRMLCKSDDLRVRHEIVKAEGDTVTAKWVANYEFNGNPIENHVTATIKLKDGKIVEHTDSFDMSAWLRQAYGMAARLPFAEHILGGLTRHVAGARLDRFIANGG